MTYQDFLEQGSGVNDLDDIEECPNCDHPIIFGYCKKCGWAIEDGIVDDAPPFDDEDLEDLEDDEPKMFAGIKDIHNKKYK